MSVALNPLPAWATEQTILTILDTLRRHDVWNPISSLDIARGLGIDDAPGQPGVRAVITEILRRGLAPIGAKGNGYFLIKTEEELDVYTRQLEQREQGIRARIVAVRRTFFEGPRDFEREPMWKWVPMDAEEREV